MGSLKYSKRVVNLRELDINNAIGLLRNLNCDVVISNSEADHTLTSMSNKIENSFILSGDSDFLLLGSNSLILYPNFKDNSYEIIYLENVLKCLNLNYAQFVDFCLLCGTDYYSKCDKNLGPAKILKLVTNLNQNQIDKVVESKFNWPKEKLFNLRKFILTQKLTGDQDSIILKSVNDPSLIKLSNSFAQDLLKN